MATRRSKTTTKRTSKPKRASRSRKATTKGSSRKPAKRNQPSKSTKRASKKSPKKTAKKATKRASKKAAKSGPKKTAKSRSKSPAKVDGSDAKSVRTADKVTTPGLRQTPRPKSTQPKDHPDPPTEAKGSKSTKKATKRGSSKTVPGGTAPQLDDVTRGRQALRELRLIVENASDADAEVILGDGNLEALLSSIVPPLRGDSIHDHLAEHKRRASLLARIRHGINERSAFFGPGGYIAPTRAQWFYDGLTFLEGAAPYQGVVGLYRDGVIRYGVGVSDVAKGDSLGPLASDFVSLQEARKSLRAAKGAPLEGKARLQQMLKAGQEDVSVWTSLLKDHPWILGCQHVSIEATSSPNPELPQLTGKRSSDGGLDVFVIEPPSTPLVGKTNRVLASFKEVWARAEQLRTFVQRQSDYLKRELGWKIRDPRFYVIAGRCGPAERQIIRGEMEAHFAAIRLLTYDEVASLANRTLELFESRV